jgi:tetratricopeptide (TPR) repeat protein
MGLFKKLFAGEPTSARDHYEEGLASEHTGDHEQALAHFTQAIRLDANFAHAHYARAFAREIIGDYDQAIADFERVIELNPAVLDELVLEMDGDSGAGRVVRLKKEVQWREGMIELGAMLDTVRVCYLRGVRSVDAGDFDQAIADFSEALERSPFGNDPNDLDLPFGPAHPAATYFERGRCFCRTGQFREAIDDLQAAAEYGALALGAMLSRP